MTCWKCSSEALPDDVMCLIHQQEDERHKAASKAEWEHALANVQATLDNLDAITGRKR